MLAASSYDLVSRPDSALLFTRRFNLMRNALLAIVIALCALLIVAYAGDYAVLHVRIARHGSDSVLSTVTTFYAAPIKGGRMSIYYDQPQLEPCVRSIFPQLGYAPCWYLRRHAVQLVD
jgi:hypothetical protein